MKKYIYTAILLTIFNVSLIIFLSKIGNSYYIDIERESKAKEILSFQSFENWFYKRKRAKYVNHIKSEIMIILRTKALFCVKMIADLILIIAISNINHLYALLTISIFIHYILMTTIEPLYILDNKNLLLYYQLGERGSRFLFKKIMTSILYTCEILIVFVVKAIYLRINILYFVFLLLIWIFFILYFNSFYFWEFINITKCPSIIHDIIFLLVSFISIIPVVSLVVGITFYFVGGRKWEKEKYVVSK